MLRNALHLGRLSVGILVIVGAIMTANCGAPSSGVDLAIAGRANAEPSVTARGRVVVVTWAAAGDTATDVYAAVSRDAGRTFGAPVRVNDAASAANVSGEQPPRAVLLPQAGHDPAIVVAWTSHGASGTRLLTARSTDGGATFGAAAPLPGSDAPGNRGWESMVAAPDGRVFAIWLDHRELAAMSSSMLMPHEGQAHTGHGDANGVARAQLSKLYVAALGGTASQSITGGVCYCCKTALAAGSDGSIYAAWRHVYPGNIRDIAFTASHDGGRTFAAPVPVSHDRWALDGCPENGPALAVDASNGVHVVWPTLVNGAGPGGTPNLALFYAFTTDGTQFSPRQAIPTHGTPRHPVVAISATGAMLVAWDEQADGTRRIAMATAVLKSRGGIALTRFSAGDSPPSEYPSITATSDGFVAAWKSGPADRSVIHVTRITPP